MKKLTILLPLLFIFPAVAETHVVEAYSMTFEPDVVTVQPGDVIRWEYVTGYPHDVTSGSKCSHDGYLFLDIPDMPGGFVEWTVPEDAPSEISYFCELHCGSGMTGMINVELPQGNLNIGIVDIVNPVPMVFTRAGDIETISITGDNFSASSFMIGVEAEDVDVDVDWVASGDIQFYQPSSETYTALNGSGTQTLLSGQKYAFIGDGIFDFEISFYSLPDEGNAYLSGLSLNGHGSITSSGDMFIFRTSSIATAGQMAFDGEGAITMSVAGNVTSSLTLPPSGEEGSVTIPSGTHYLDFSDFAFMTMNMNGGDGGGGGIPEDVNGDCVVNVSDLLQIISVWGSTCP
ncbi:MAG: hypothetical protein CMJ26_07495 [Phycisphaerae bacterium]|nr:hypothetical protein [Phycisphaerae bacterium]|tara:strand:+ start:4145 stop:5182 length:1038 start_codon:yes stop_codon:yes gene_type:complete